MTLCRVYDLANVGRYKLNKKLGWRNRLQGTTLAEPLVDKETGKAMNLREARNSEGPMKTIKEIQNNIDSIKEQVDGLKP